MKGFAVLSLVFVIIGICLIILANTLALLPSVKTILYLLSFVMFALFVLFAL